MSKWLSTLAAFLMAIIFSALAYSFWLAYQPIPNRLQGQIEAQQYNISSKVPGRIAEVMVRKGDRVSSGQLIYTLLSPELEAKLEQAKAGSEAAGALAEEAIKGARVQQVEAAKDVWQKAKAASELAEKTYKRISALYEEGVIAEQKKDEAFTRFQAAGYTENAAYQMYQLAKEGTREETKKAAREQARAAREAVAEVKAYADETTVNSWHDGEVTEILLHSGEIAPAGFPVVSIVDMQDAWAIFQVVEDQLSAYQPGTEFTVVIPALGEQSHPFKVSHVSVMGDFATWRATDATKGFDMRTFEVEARPLEPVDGLRVGMSALVE